MRRELYIGFQSLVTYPDFDLQLQELNGFAGAGRDRGPGAQERLSTIERINADFGERVPGEHSITDRRGCAGNDLDDCAQLCPLGLYDAKLGMGIRDILAAH